VVEGRYDKNTLRQAVDAVIIETDGFGVFSDKEKLSLLRRLAERRGLIILTDSDSAGFLIRNYLKGSLPRDKIKHAYIPDVSGKEKRKTAPAREGKLGVEGMRPQILLTALKNAGATMDGPAADSQAAPERRITKTDLYLAGLSGGKDSGERRKALLRALDLPARLSPNAMLEVLNALLSYEAFQALASEL